MKERVTLTLDVNILRSVDGTVDGTKIKNRSHAVELLLVKALGDYKPKVGIILAGGKGTRMRPLTHEIPKPLLPVHDKPILDHLLDLFKIYGIKDVLISIGYKGEKIKEYFGDGKRLGINITYLEEDKPLGTAGPLKLAKPFIKDTFVMSNSDELKDLDLSDMFKFHKEYGAKATIALWSMNDPSNYGVARMQGNKIIEFVEKPPKGKQPSNFINSGLYILDPSVIDLIPEGQSSIERDIFPKLAKEGTLFGYPFSGQWLDTGTFKDYENALKHWKDLV